MRIHWVRHRRIVDGPPMVLRSPQQRHLPMSSLPCDNHDVTGPLVLASSVQGGPPVAVEPAAACSPVTWYS